MPKVPASVKSIPWAVLLEIAKEALKRGSAVSRALGPDGRSRVVALVQKSKGRPSNLTKRERNELQKLGSKALDALRHPDKFEK